MLLPGAYMLGLHFNSYGYVPFNHHSFGFYFLLLFTSFLTMARQMVPYLNHLETIRGKGRKQVENEKVNACMNWCCPPSASDLSEGS